MTTLANALAKEGSHLTEEEALYRRSLAIQERVVGPDHPHTMQAKEGLANELTTEHHYWEAARLLREVLATRLRTLGPEDTDTLLTQYNLADVAFEQHQLVEAERILRRTIEVQARVLEANDPDTLASRTLLARVLLAGQKAREAEAVAREALEVQLRVLGPQHDDTLDSLSVLGEALARLGRYNDARLLYMQLIAQTMMLPKGNASLAWCQLATLAADTGHGNDAFRDLEQAVKAGYADVAGLRKNQAWRLFRNDPRFARALVRAKEHAGAGQRARS